MAINLLPTKQKRFARSVYQTHRLIAILIVFDLLLLTTLVLLIALNVTVKQEKNTNAKTLSSLNSKSSVIEFNQLRDEVGLIAKYADVARDNADADFLVTDYFDQVIIVRPAGVYLNNIDYASDESGQTIKLGGVASNRQSLLDFDLKLESLPWVESVDSPVTNLVGDNNFVFSLTLTLVKSKP